MALEIGAKYFAVDTQMNRMVGIKKGSKCYITFLEPAHVSFYAERSPNPGAGFIEARTTREIFGKNFEPDPVSAPNLGYRQGRPYTRTYP